MFLAVLALMMFSAWPLAAWSGVPIGQVSAYVEGRNVAQAPANNQYAASGNYAQAVAGVPVNQVGAYVRGQAVTNKSAERTVYRTRIVYKPVTIPAETVKYTLKAGDTFWGLAKKLNLKNWTVLAALNHMTRHQAGHMKYGRVILIPKPFAETKLGKSEAVNQRLLAENSALKKQLVDAKKFEATISDLQKKVADLQRKLNAAVTAKPTVTKKSAAVATSKPAAKSAKLQTPVKASSKLSKVVKTPESKASSLDRTTVTLIVVVVILAITNIVTLIRKRCTP
ncbi:MAG: LysM peptidoglycan-binding domain-containing protein [Candidatus Pacebacteria bacterium]|nr:LysM peptidoglycan-binding domain-containing protein [Candidatus Paceibacterota bacterium]